MDERKLLIADDSELNRAILVSVLEKNFDILEAADGKEAIATLAAHEGNIAALLLDVVMPEADGFEVLEEMNRRGWIDEIPTIMISVETGGSYIDRAFQLGAADYVSRPFVPNMIRRRVINAILLHTKTRKLTGLIADRFYRRERNTDILAAILGYAVEFRSGERGTHMTNVSRITGLLLHRLLERTDRCPIGPEDIETVCIASSLHDIGKLLIPEDILIKASNGASDFGNKFGQPLICGSLLTFEHEEDGRTYGYDKVIMQAGGVGFGNRQQAMKKTPGVGDKVVLLGGDNYRIGMGGGAVSSVDTGVYAGAIELNAVQRSNPEMQKRVCNAIRAMAESEVNPIVSIHDHGAGGGTLQQVHAPHQGGLARPVFTHEGDTVFVVNHE